MSWNSWYSSGILDKSTGSTAAPKALAESTLETEMVKNWLSATRANRAYAAALINETEGGALCSVSSETEALLAEEEENELKEEEEEDRGVFRGALKAEGVLVTSGTSGTAALGRAELEAEGASERKERRRLSDQSINGLKRRSQSYPNTNATE